MHDSQSHRTYACISPTGAVRIGSDPVPTEGTSNILLTIETAHAGTPTPEQRAAVQRTMSWTLTHALAGIGNARGLDIPDDTVVTVRTADTAQGPGAQFLACYRGMHTDGFHILDRLGNDGQRALSLLRPSAIDQIHAHTGRHGILDLAILEAESGELTVDAFTALAAHADEAFVAAIAARTLELEPVPTALALAALSHISDAPILERCRQHPNPVIRRIALTRCTNVEELVAQLCAINRTEAFESDGAAILQQLQAINPLAIIRFLVRVRPHWESPFFNGADWQRNASMFYLDLIRPLPPEQCIDIVRFAKNERVLTAALYHLHTHPELIEQLLQRNDLDTELRRTVVLAFERFNAPPTPIGGATVTAP
ncbi:hypothetical protein HYV74_02245 [Candidatus Uhrbacteria bacterium]|nr:hypothetical protein [Candidatus Uhrbacteria bacterium]